MEQIPQINEYSKSNWPNLPTFIIVILLLITYPLGVILMWLFTKWSVKIKLLVTFGPALIVISLIAYLFFSLSGQRQTIKKERIQTQIESGINDTTN